MEIQAESRQKSKQIITLEQGSLKSATTSSMSDVDTSTELRLFFALQRRHLAFEIVHLLSWQPCQVWLDKLMGSLIQEPPHAASSLGLTQILKADREILRSWPQNTVAVSLQTKERPRLWMTFSRG